MRLSFVILLCCLLQVSANTYSQNTSLNIKLVNASIKEVFKDIKEQSEFTFVYNVDDIEKLGKINCEFKESTIEEILDYCMEGTEMTYKVRDKVINIVPKDKVEEIQKQSNDQLQKITITGKVSDKDGIPLPVVSIIVKGTTVGIVTDQDGNYTLEIPIDAEVLVFSFVGMKTVEEVIGGRTTINVVLEEVLQDVDEVMIIAYGTIKKESFTGSAKTLGEEKLRSTQSSDISEALQGNVSGVEISQSSGSPGTSPSIRIRGVGSINASSEPLIVVDGMPYGNSLNTINPQDIEKMSVLKDAAATALYGSRAANGAILITTKKGKEDRTSVEFSAQWGISSRAIEDYETVGAVDYYELMWEGLYNAYIASGYTNAAELASKSVVSKQVYNPFNIDQPVGLDGKIKADAKLLWEDNWSENIYNKGNKQEYGLSFAGGNDKSQNYFSLGYLDFEGILINSNFERYSARLDNQRLVFDWLKIGANFAGSTSTSNEPIGESGSLRSLNYQASAIPSIYPIYLRDQNGKIIKDDNGKPFYDYGINGDEDGRAQRPYWAMPRSNFLGSEQYDKNTLKNDQLSFRTFAEISIYTGLTWKASLSYDYTSIGKHRFLNSKYGEGATTVGSGFKSESKQKAWNLNNLLTYDKKIDNHSFNILAGHERYSLNYSYLEASKTNFIFEDMQELAVGSVVSNPPNSFIDNYRVESFLSRINYDFDNRYYLSLSYRTDGSSRFEKDVRWGNFWSIGTSWRISQENFMESTNDWLDNLKLKASYGTLGNDNLGTYYAYQQLYLTGNNNLNQTGVQISRLGTPNLTWEVSKTSNVGIEFGLFDFVNIEFEMFKRKVEDMLFARPLPLSAGITSIDENIGDMRNTGFEIDLFAKLVDKREFIWTFEINATHYKNEITRLVQDEIITGKYHYKVGNSAYDFYLKEWAGVDKENGDPLYYTGNKNATERETVNDWFTAKKYNLGSALPDLFGGFSNTLAYKGFEFTTLFNYKIGGTLYDMGYQLITHSGIYSGLNLHVDVLDHWTPENPDSKNPGMNSFNYNGNITSSRYLFDTTYLRLRNLVFSYNLPSEICSKAKMKQCKVSFIGQNLFTIYNGKGFDPEAGFSNDSDYNYPQMKVISLGLNVVL